MKRSILVKSLREAIERVTEGWEAADQQACMAQAVEEFVQELTPATISKKELSTLIETALSRVMQRGKELGYS